MTNIRQPATIEERLIRLETFFANVGETVAQNYAIANMNENLNAQSPKIDILVAKIHRLTEDVAASKRSADALTTYVAEVSNRVDSLASVAVQERQQIAIDWQEFRQEMRQIEKYLRDRLNGGSSTP